MYLSPFPVTTEAFKFPPCPVTVLLTMAQLEINVSNLSGMPNVTSHPCGVVGRGLHFDGNFCLCTHLVSRSCHARVLTNVEFKLWCSQRDSHCCDVEIVIVCTLYRVT